jgi:hypothetical protein
MVEPPGLRGADQAATYLRTDLVIGMLGSTEAYVRFVHGDMP